MLNRAMPFISVALMILAFIVGRVTAGVGSGGRGSEKDYYINAAKLYDAAVKLDTPPADANDPKRWEKVLAAYRSVFDEYPDSEYADDALYAIASRLDTTENPDAAFALYRRLLEDHPDSEHAPAALNAIGVALFKRGEKDSAAFDRSLVLFDQFLREYPSSPLAEKVAMNHAICQYRRGKYDVALAELLKFTEDYPQSDQIAATIFYAGMIYYEKQDYEQARVRFQNIIDLNDKELAPAAHFNMGQTFFDERRYDEAIAAYRRTMQVFPDTEYAQEGMFRIGWALERQGKFNEAVTTLKQAMEKYPNSKNTPAAQLFLAEIYLQGMKDTDKAVAALRSLVDGTIPVESIETSKRSAYDIRRHAQYVIGKIYEDKKDFKRAVEEYQKLLKEFPEPHSEPSHKSNNIDEAYILDLQSKAQ